MSKEQLESYIGNGELSSITKKCVATHANYFLNFKMALYFSVLVMKLCNSSRKLF